MSLFKSKKTYIRRYSSKNFDKKVTFSPSVKSTFSSPVINITSDDREKRKYKETQKQSGPTGTIRFAHDEKYKSAFTDQKPEYVKSAVVSGPSSTKPEPVQKPDLTGVKAGERVRPIVENEVQSQPEPMHTPIASTDEVVVNVPKKENKPKIKKQHKKTQFSIQPVILFAKGVLVAAIVLGIAFAGYKLVTMPQLSISQTQEPVVYTEELNDLPAVPDNIKAQIQQKRKEYEAQNVYNEGAYEVRGIYKFDDYVKTCYLTFDDGPSDGVTTKILDVLKQYDIKATFFVVGENANAYPDTIRRMHAEGHSIGNHSYSHNYDYLYSNDPAFESELSSCKNTINSILGTNYDNMLFRFPGGLSGNQRAGWYLPEVNSEGYRYIDWNALSGDSEVEKPTKEYIMESIRKSTNDGRKEDIVVLMHDAGAKSITAETLPDVIEYLKSKNYVFKPILSNQ